MKIYKITRRGMIEVTEDGGQLWKHVDGAVINEQITAFMEEMNKERQQAAQQSTQHELGAFISTQQELDRLRRSAQTFGMLSVDKGQRL